MASTASKLNQLWTLMAILLLATIIAGGLVVWSRCSPSQPIEIAMPPGQELPTRIFIGGAVTNPGFYPLTDGDSIETLIQAAGGIASSANLSGPELYIARLGEEPESQRIDVNRAEVWLLKALPGIGETLAQRIINYRQQNGPFLNTNELLKVEGIGTATYEQIRHLITVSD